MANKKILPSLLKVNIFTLLFVFCSAVGYNVYVALKIRSFDRVSTSIHDFADLSQYAITLVLQKKSLAKDEPDTEIIESIIRFEEDLKIRINLRKKSFLDVYSFTEYEEFSKKILLLTGLNEDLKSLGETKLLNQLEDVYVYILRFSARHNTLVEEFFETRLNHLIFSFIMVTFIVIYILFTRIKSIITPLREITSLSKSVSISSGQEKEIEFSQKAEYYEYQVLLNSLKEMHRRVHYENRMSSHESASESIGHFAENLAHSINNPLAIIATSIKVLNKIAKKEQNQIIFNETNQVLEEIQRITDITHKMKSLINTSSKQDAEDFKAFNLITTVNLLFFNRMFEKNIQFFYDKDVELILYGKEEIITQIIVTLVENAIEYNDASRPKIELIFERFEDKAMIHVRDNGSAPAKEFIELNMNGDINTKSMGLYTAKKSATENGYELDYFDEPVKEFILTVPIKLNS